MADNKTKSGEELTLRDIDNEGLMTIMNSQEDLLSSFSKDIPLGSQMIVGMRFQGEAQEMAYDLTQGARISLMREPGNRFDPKAVMVLDKDGRRVGYIPRTSNEIVGALLDAGKVIYGIVNDEHLGSADPEGNGRGQVPFTLRIDLFMREFSMPGQMTEIPRQGSDGSYEVLDLRLDMRRRKYHEMWRLISSICAIKVINGVQRGVFQKEIPEDAELDQAKSIYSDFFEFTGYLLIVEHGLSARTKGSLTEAYGVLLGRPFSNHVIDTVDMARNHLPQASDYSLEGLADYLGIEADCMDEQEENCRIIWQLYRRMDKSELERNHKSELEIKRK